MRWSKLKQMIEERMAPSLAGRVEVWVTRYPKAHDSFGRGWITIDGREVANFSDSTFVNVFFAKVNEQRRPRGDETPVDGFQRANYEALEFLKEQAILARWDFTHALWDSLSLSIDDALASENVVIRAIAMTDRRLGKRRLHQLQIGENEHPLVQILYALRCEAEGIRPPTPDHRIETPTEPSPPGQRT